MWLFDAKRFYICSFLMQRDFIYVADIVLTSLC